MSVYLNGTSVLLNSGSVATNATCCCGCPANICDGTACSTISGHITTSLNLDNGCCLASGTVDQDFAYGTDHLSVCPPLFSGCEWFFGGFFDTPPLYDTAFYDCFNAGCGCFHGVQPAIIEAFLTVDVECRTGGHWYIKVQADIGISPFGTDCEARIIFGTGNPADFVHFHDGSTINGSISLTLTPITVYDVTTGSCDVTITFP